MSKALKTRMEENTMECNCGMKWMTSVEEMSDVNFCSTTASFRSIRSFIKAKCMDPFRKRNHSPSTTSSGSFLSVLSILTVTVVSFL
ncbi:hypothetical protein B9Z55_011698 [Caenorhabditis nigoni]|nr:hypothetical protein B9Z55_011698 [Caenorhabditis nigoni]